MAVPPAALPPSPPAPISPVPGYPYGPMAPHGRMKTHSGETAGTLVLVGLILEIVGTTIVGLLLALFLPFFFFGLTFLGALAFGIVATIVGIAALVIFAGYEFSYRRISVGDYEGARTPTLVLGILLIFLALISGILYLIAYAKLGDAINEQRWPGMMYPPGYGGAAAYPMGYGAAAPTMCPRCGHPATFIPQYGRYYCYNCRNYV